MTNYTSAGVFNCICQDQLPVATPERKFDPKFECKVKTNGYIATSLFHIKLTSLFSCTICTDTTAELGWLSRHFSSRASFR